MGGQSDSSVYKSLGRLYRKIGNLPINFRLVGETGDNCNTGHVVTGDPTPRENDLRWLF